MIFNINKINSITKSRILNKISITKIRRNQNKKSIKKNKMIHNIFKNNQKINTNFINNLNKTIISISQVITIQMINIYFSRTLMFKNNK